MVQFCPISNRTINENVSRLNAFYTFLFAGLYLLSSANIFLAVLIIDFILRLYNEGKSNPVTRMNIYILDKLKVSKKMINAGPKIFAARIGLTLAVMAAILVLAAYYQIAIIVIGILVFFSFLEFAFGLCVACKIYPYALFVNDLKLFRR
jgi:hypothetical protein